MSDLVGNPEDRFSQNEAHTVIFGVFFAELEEDGTASQLCTGEDYRHLKWLKSHLYLQDTLKYLCRTAIRGYLGQTRDITCAIDKLQLPKALKGFLSLNDVSEEI